MLGDNQVEREYRQKGFTLIELLVVIAVLSVLVSGMMIFINPAKRFKQANDARIKSDIRQISMALLSYFTIMRHYPTTADGNLNALITDNDLRTIPSPPSGGATNYSYIANVACGVSPYTGCEAVLYYILRDPQISGNVWCWRSVTGRTVEMSAPPVDCNP